MSVRQAEGIQISVFDIARKVQLVKKCRGIVRGAHQLCSTSRRIWVDSCHLAKALLCCFVRLVLGENKERKADETGKEQSKEHVQNKASLHLSVRLIGKDRSLHYPWFCKQATCPTQPLLNHLWSSDVLLWAGKHSQTPLTIELTCTWSCSRVF